MQIELESSLRRWTDAGLVDANQADRIKEIESLVLGSASSRRTASDIHRAGIGRRDAH